MDMLPFTAGEKISRAAQKTFNRLFTAEELDELRFASEILAAQLPHKFNTASMCLISDTPYDQLIKYATMAPKARVNKAYKEFKIVPRWGIADRDMDLLPFVQTDKEHSDEMIMLFDALLEAGVLEDYMAAAQAEYTEHLGRYVTREELIREIKLTIYQHDVPEVISSDITPQDFVTLTEFYLKTGDNEKAAGQKARAIKDLYESAAAELLYEGFPELKARHDRYEEKELLIDRGVKAIDILQWNTNALATCVAGGFSCEEFGPIMDSSRKLIHEKPQLQDVADFFGKECLDAIGALSVPVQDNAVSLPLPRLCKTFDQRQSIMMRGQDYIRKLPQIIMAKRDSLLPSGPDDGPAFIAA